MSEDPAQPTPYLGMTLRVYTVTAEGERVYRPTTQVRTDGPIRGFYPPCCCPRCLPRGQQAEAALEEVA